MFELYILFTKLVLLITDFRGHGLRIVCLFVCLWSYDPRPSTSGQTNEGYGNQNQNWSNNRPSDRWTPTTLEPSYNSYIPAHPIPAPRPAQQFYREDTAGQSYVDNYANDYNVGSEDATPPQGETYYRHPNGRHPFRGGRRGGRGPRHATRGRQKREEGQTDVN